MAKSEKGKKQYLALVFQLSGMEMLFLSLLRYIQAVSACSFRKLRLHWKVSRLSDNSSPRYVTESLTCIFFIKAR